MRLAYIVTEFPKITETFIQRELLEFHRQGHEIRIYHLTRFRRGEVVHDFARPTLGWARTRPYLLDGAVLGALARALARRPLTLCGLVARICAACWRRPAVLAKSLMILPKSLWMAEDAGAWPASHVHAGFAGHPATCAWIISRIAGLPYSVSCHANDIFRTQVLLAEKLCRAAFVRAISDFNKTFLLERLPGLDGSRIEVIHCGVDTERVEAFPAPEAGETFRVLYVGSLEPKKGVGVLLRALARGADLGPWRCEIVGDGPERQALEALASRSGLADRVVFRGAQPGTEVSRALARANVLVVPSIVGPGGRAEGIPVVIMEGLAHQRPVIASRLTGIPELIEHEETGYLVPPGDEEALLRALETVRREPERAYAAAVRGRSRVMAEFDIRANAERQLRLFEAHAAAGRTARR